MKTLHLPIDLTAFQVQISFNSEIYIYSCHTQNVSKAYFAHRLSPICLFYFSQTPFTQDVLPCLICWYNHPSTTLFLCYQQTMGFEQAVPPVPDRQAELNMLNRLEQSWLNQPYNRYYMQEDLRQTKMEYAKYNLETRRKFLMNCIFFSAITLPFAYIARRFYTYSSFKSGGIPFTKELTYFERERTVAFDRNKAANKSFVLIYLASTAVLSFAFTNWHYRSDENYDKFSKVKKML